MPIKCTWNKDRSTVPCSYVTLDCFQKVGGKYWRMCVKFPCFSLYFLENPTVKNFSVADRTRDPTVYLWRPGKWHANCNMQINIVMGHHDGRCRCPAMNFVSYVQPAGDLVNTGMSAAYMWKTELILSIFCSSMLVYICIDYLRAKTYHAYVD